MVNLEISIAGSVIHSCRPKAASLSRWMRTFLDGQSFVVLWLSATLSISLKQQSKSLRNAFVVIEANGMLSHNSKKLFNGAFGDLLISWRSFGWVLRRRNSDFLWRIQMNPIVIVVLQSYWAEHDLLRKRDNEQHENSHRIKCWFYE